MIILLSIGLLGSIAAKEPMVSRAVYKAIQTAEQQLAKSAYQQALKPLQQQLAEIKKGSYDEAVLWKTIGAVYSLQGSYTKAASAIEKSLANGSLPAQQVLDAQLNLGQVYLALNKYSQALTQLKPWIDQQQSPTADNYQLLAQVYAQLENYSKALRYAKLMLSNSKKPSETQYQFVVALYFENKDYQSAASLLEKLVAANSDKKNYWQQLTASYHQQGNIKKALAVKDLAWRSGILNSTDDVLQLVQLFAYNGSPYLAADLYQQQIKQGLFSSNRKHLTQLSDLWLQAREYKKAGQSLQQAANISQDGNLFQRLGNLFSEQQDWKSACTALQQAVKLGHLKDTGNAWMSLGVCSHQLGNQQQAYSAFNKALGFSKTRSAATQWLVFIKKS
jgi:tetratricopeptide (TPR) repeat protein